jgi:hypothetical protein
MSWLNVVGFGAGLTIAIVTADPHTTMRYDRACKNLAAGRCRDARGHRPDR